MDDTLHFETLLFKWRDADDPKEKRHYWNQMHIIGSSTDDTAVRNHWKALINVDYLATWELCELLKQRLGVEEKTIAPYYNEVIEVEGPAVVYVVTD